MIDFSTNDFNTFRASFETCKMNFAEVFVSASISSCLLIFITYMKLLFITRLLPTRINILAWSFNCCSMIFSKADRLKENVYSSPFINFLSFASAKMM